MSTTRRMRAHRIKLAALAYINERISACLKAEERYLNLSREPNGGMLGSVDLAERAAATERSARMEAELIRNFIAALPASGEPSDAHEH